MSMEHKAFIFDDKAFRAELRPIIERSLSTGQVSELVSFIETNLSALKDPYDGEPLSEAWHELVESKDAHQYGDFALTKFYDPRCDIGLGGGWELIQPLIPESTCLLLGVSVGSTGCSFDPGKMGSYFRSDEDVEHNLQTLDSFLKRNAHLSTKLDELRDLLLKAKKADRGLYVTF